ncbi:MAG: DUF4142 domain-containing protein [Verrucomicrobium sp.]
MKTLPTLALALAAGFAMITAAPAADAGALNTADQKFVKMAAQHGASEVKVAEIGAKKAENSEVKALAEMIIKDHTAANAELKTFATAKGVDLSSSAPADAATKVQDLERQSGKAFDKEFLKDLIASHKKSVSHFEEASKDSKDGELKAWVDKTLPSLKAHLEQAKALEAKY